MEAAAEQKESQKGDEETINEEMLEQENSHKLSLSVLEDLRSTFFFFFFPLFFFSSFLVPFFIFFLLTSGCFWRIRGGMEKALLLSSILSRSELVMRKRRRIMTKKVCFCFCFFIYLFII